MTRKLLTAVPVALCLVLVTGCAPQEPAPMTDDDPEVAALEQELERFRENYEQRLDRVEERIDRMQDVAEEPQREEQLDQLTLRREHLQDRIRELDPVPGPAFEQMRSELQRELDSLEQDVAQLEGQLPATDEMQDPAYQDEPGTSPGG